MKNYILFYFFMISLVAQGQIVDDFSDGDFNTNPTWDGQTSNFIINTNNQLQLNAPEAGTSNLQTEIQIGPDMQWEFFLLMDFSPSGSNQCIIHLMQDTQQSGYSIRIGKTGAEDALEFLKRTNDTYDLLATGTIGAMSTDPAQARVRVILSNNSSWTIEADYTGGDNFEIEMEFDEPVNQSGNMSFGIQCKYTSTRTEAFFFDDFFLPFIPDNTAPEFLSSLVQDENSLILCFNEDIVLPSLSSISIEPAIPIQDLEYFGGMQSKIRIQFAETIQQGQEYLISIDNFIDQNGNSNSLSNAIFFTLSPPDIGDLVINEILVDPLSGGSDFIEIFNNSQKKIDLKNLYIANLSKDEMDEIRGKEFLNPFQYLVLCPDLEFLKENYIIQEEGNLLDNSIPSYNISSGNVSLQYMDGTTTITIDSFDYTEDLHFSLLDNTKGVSLERLSASAPTYDFNNWHSASSASGFATPGYANSNLIIENTSENTFELDKTVFSPDGDGFEDFLILNYRMEKAGFLLKLSIFDANGKFVVNLEDALLPSTTGFVKWNGVNAENRKAKMGIYILHISGFHPDGERVASKQVFAVAESL